MGKGAIVPEDDLPDLFTGKETDYICIIKYRKNITSDINVELNARGFLIKIL